LKLTDMRQMIEEAREERKKSVPSSETTRQSYMTINLRPPMTRIPQRVGLSTVLLPGNLHGLIIHRSTDSTYTHNMLPVVDKKRYLSWGFSKKQSRCSVDYLPGSGYFRYVNSLSGRLCNLNLHHILNRPVDELTGKLWLLVC
jgi:hypothetical protein